MVAGTIAISSAGLSFLMFLFLAKALGAEEYGRFAPMFSLGSFLAFVALLGQQTRVLKRLPGWIDAAEFGSANQLLRQALIVVIALGIFLSAGLFLCHMFFPSQDLSRLALGACFLVIPFSLAALFASSLRALGMLAFALLPRDVIWRLIIVILALASGWSTAHNISAEEAMFIVSTVLAVLVLIQVLIFFKLTSYNIWSAHPVKLNSGILRDSVWYWLAAISGIMANHLTVVLSSINLSASETGALFAAMKLSQLLNLPVIASNMVNGPIISRLYFRKDFDGIQRACRSVVPLLLSSVLGFLLLLLFPGWMLRLFDSEYAIAVPALLILSVAQLVPAMCGNVGVLMLMAGGERRFLFLTTLSEGSGLCLLIFLAPKYGLVGAALAVLFGKLGWNLLAVFWCRTYLGVDPTVLSLLRR